MSNEDEATRLAVIGLPWGMSTRAPLPARSLIAVNACGGAGLKLESVKSEAWISVRALMSWLATTIRVPVVLPWISGRLAIAAAAANASTASTAPMTMYRRPRRGRASAEVAMDT